ncbi:acid phosphatase [Rhodococcus sp. Leaf7]|uniref:bifunctional RNase H/acid phosphatase n=1 Tax=unclassified Rhodococcus (in: high G+C Gram-positive bacteria) TaxID=192944 RepID=UPI0006FC2CED|nr:MULTISPECIES: bifunctional RNase H/acid phosphatase [unclassified Rhodococcus (in: high G+C Gram-positive bacteria)]KQU02587.1 acid phosphatase [Rhodococcus sp. Leaf7]KQU38058.1 acid phosphatase [Rhodococcus sp. Leaf247]
MTSVVVEADGGSRGNPGPAGYGAVVWDSARRNVLAERREHLGVATNNVAEYRGLIAGLDAAREIGATRVSVRMDSKLVVEQMSGRWKVKHPDMIPLRARAADIAETFEYVDYTWIPRAENSHADRLANQAMDGEDSMLTGGESAPAPVAERPPWQSVSGAATRTVLLRHGQTALSVDKRYSGRGNPELTELGRAQAASAAGRIAVLGGIDAIVSSPLGRARETAEAVSRSTGVAVTTLDSLTETDFGSWEGLTFREVSEGDPDLHGEWMSDTSVRPPGGESFDEVRERVRGARDSILRDYAGKTVVVVSHVTPIKTLLQFGLDVGPSILYRLHLDLASISIVDWFDDDAASVRLVNDTSYLWA